MLTTLTINKQENAAGFIGRFNAMASDCEVLVDGEEISQAESIINTVFAEAKRIEAKFSRYLTTNIVYRINNSGGKKILLDEETSLLLNFAYQCYQLSDGLFDITSGVLRQAWHFNGSDNIPSARQINKLLPFIGLDKVHWQAPELILPEGMELDFGGIGKEYAVDCCLAKVLQVSSNVPVLLNFGGDLRCTRARRNDRAWQVGIDNIAGEKPALVTLKQGAIATSGDARRYLLKNGQRYSHILNPLTGYSVLGAPRSITVAAASCIEAGLLSTLAMLQGKQAKQFLEAQQVKYWIQ